MDFLTPAKQCWCNWVSLQLCECHFSVLIFLNDGGKSLCIRNPLTVQVIQVFLPAKPFLRKGFTWELIHTLGVSHRAITQTPTIRGFVKLACLWLSNILDQCRKHYTAGIFIPPAPFIFHATLYSSPVTHCSPHPRLAEVDVWLHVFTMRHLDFWI